MERESALKFRNLSTENERRKRETNILTGKATNAEKRATDATLGAKDLDNQLIAA